MGHGLPSGLGVKTVYVGVGDEEGVRVPEGEDEAAPYLVAGVPAEVEVCRRVVAGEEPAHYVHPHPLGRLGEPDSVALALVHLFALLVAEEGIAEAATEGLPVLEDRAHRQQRVEPVAELAGEALRYPVRREPLLPVRAVLAILERGIRDDAGVQPGVTDILDA